MKPALAGEHSIVGCPASHDSVGAGLFKSVLRQHAATVTVVTAGLDVPVGFCATSFTSVSLDPPLVSFCVGLQASSWSTLRVAPKIMVHLLADTQVDLARRFAQSAAARFGSETRWHQGPFGLPVLQGVMAWLVLEPVSRTPVGDHALIVGTVVQAEHAVGRRPLVHHDGRFTSLAS